ncbi:hypothetical protein GE061_002351 [Apolygus lucorum]|uniref:Uncharacterized protein n=1 Tax=Apolygus lucorum TaxID=248454 RepID=A0A6A4JH26_APOLU|nr:hypothetical protein GE061_002351 [Apolygus lucorum]
MPGKFVDSYPKNAPEAYPESFVGAVVNFEPSWTKGSPKMASLINAASFAKYAEQAAATGAEVLVFPEGAFRSTTGEPVPVDIPPLGSNMCDAVSFPDQSQIMSLLSCAAYSAKLFLVASVDEIVVNKTCSSQVVFDDDGTLVARHREYNCLDDDDDDDDQYFIMTPSEIKIGLILTQDLVEFEIVNDLVSSGVIHYALSYNSKEIFPFDSSLQTEHWWSFGRDVFLMASGLTRNAENDRRSGIYGGRSNGRCLPMVGDQGLVVADIPFQRGSSPNCLDVDWSTDRDRPLKRELRALGANRMTSHPAFRTNDKRYQVKSWSTSVSATSTNHDSKDSKDDSRNVKEAPNDSTDASKDSVDTSGDSEESSKDPTDASIDSKDAAKDGKHYDDYGAGDDYYDEVLVNEKVTMLPVTHDMSGLWTRLCQYDFCCSFYIETTPDDHHPGYRLMVFSGPSLDFGPNVRVDRCGLIQCHECEGNDVNTFLVQSNRPGLTPNVLTDGKSASPRIRFTEKSEPKMVADHNLRSVVSAVLQTVEKENSSHSGNNDDDEDDDEITPDDDDEDNDRNTPEEDETSNNHILRLMGKADGTMFQQGNAKQ